MPDEKKIIEEYLTGTKASSTIAYQKSILQGFSSYLSGKGTSLANFSSKDVMGYYQEKQEYEEWATSSVNLFIRIIKSFCSYKYDMLEVSMAGASRKELRNIIGERMRLRQIIRMKKPRLHVRAKIDVPVTIDDLKFIFSSMLEASDIPAFCTFWALSYLGCRPGELSSNGGITPDMINVDDHRIHLITRKTKVERILFFDDFTYRYVISPYLSDNSLLNVTTQGMWYRISRYKSIDGRKCHPRMGREAFITHMSNVCRGNDELEKRFDIHLDDWFTKVLAGHTTSSNMTAVYKVYPLDLIKIVMTDHHFLRPIEVYLESI